MANKGLSTKRLSKSVFPGDALWRVWHGELVRAPGRPQKVQHLFRVVAEKIPFTALDAVRKHMLEQEFPMDGIYVAHDSMGYARYVGRGNIFNRLKARHRAQKLELVYFSFYVVLDKKHEREIETILIRAAGPQLFPLDLFPRAGWRAVRACDDASRLRRRRGQLRPRPLQQCARLRPPAHHRRTPLKGPRNATL